MRHLGFILVVSLATASFARGEDHYHYSCVQKDCSAENGKKSECTYSLDVRDSHVKLDLLSGNFAYAAAPYSFSKTLVRGRIIYNSQERLQTGETAKELKGRILSEGVMTGALAKAEVAVSTSVYQGKSSAALELRITPKSKTSPEIYLLNCTLVQSEHLNTHRIQRRSR